MFPTSVTYIAELGNTRVRWGEVKSNPVLATHARPSYARMIPKSGYRFSDKIMRKKDHSQNRPSEQDRVTPKAAVGPAFGSIMPNEQKEAERRQAH